MENQLAIIIEGQVDFEETMVVGFDLQSTISQNVQDNLFDMLYGLTYPNLIKYFGVNSSVQDLNLEYVILSLVSGVSITITPINIANAISCGDEGVVLDMLVWKSYQSPHLIFDDLSDLSKVSNLNSKALVWYHLLISNFLPKKKDMTSLDINEQSFLLLLNLDLKINLPRVMFDFLKMNRTSFKKGKSCPIPYGRVLSELFIQQGVEITMTEVK